MQPWILIVSVVIMVTFTLFIFLAMYKLILSMIVLTCMGISIYITLKVLYPAVNWIQRRL